VNDETFGQLLKRLRGDLSLRDLARLANCGKSAIGDLESGRRRPTLHMAQTLDRALDTGGALAHHVQSPPGTPAIQVAAALQRDLADSLAAGPMTDAGLEEWDYQVSRHGRATRYRTEADLLPELVADMTDLQRLLAHRHPLNVRRRLLATAAGLSGLLALTLLKLDDASARDWWRTGRAAATAAENRPVLAWIYAQESYQRYYDNDLAGAVELAVRAQQLAGGLPCVADALAAPLEARAHAAAGRWDETVAALARAQVAFDRLPEEDRQPSALGYDEAQLRFHSGSAWTLLHDTGRAWEEQQQALALYSDEQRTDRSLVILDRASCLAWDGDPATAASMAAQTLLELPLEHRSPLIVYRARDLAATVPETARSLPEMRVLREILALPSGAV
jgi:transcriptional regulator with XRE-family HTH domain